MAVVLRRPIRRMISDQGLRDWNGVPTSVIADELNRAAGMSASIAPISTASRFVGEAFTVNAMVGDNLALHVLVGQAPPGSVLIVNAGAYLGTAVWGEILHTAARARGVAAVIIDGAIRDRAFLKDSLTPIFASGSTPNGPHKGWGGSINDVIQCGGVAVSPNDLVIGDFDGIVVIPRKRLPGLLDRCQRRVLSESDVLAKILGGASTIEALGIDVTVIDESLG